MTDTVRRLPLWKNLLDKLITEGLQYGKIYTVQQFEQELSCSHTSIRFGISVHRINIAIERLGYHIKSKATSAGVLCIVQPNQHAVIAKNNERQIRKKRRRTISLMSATDMALLNPKEQKTHRKLLARAEIVYMIEKRAGKVHRYLKEKAPEMLQAK
jgi:hypothetical protein